MHGVFVTAPSLETYSGNLDNRTRDIYIIRTGSVSTIKLYDVGIWTNTEIRGQGHRYSKSRSRIFSILGHS